MDEEISMKGNLEVNKEGGYVLVSVNPKIYPTDIVLSSAYIFTDSCYVLVDGDPREEIIVELRPKNENDDLEEIGRKFNNELINYANYAVQVIKNERMRNAIIERVLMTNSAEVFEKDDYQDERGYQEANDYKKVEEDYPEEDESFELDDPEKIAIPWSEKYGKGNDKQGEE